MRSFRHLTPRYVVNRIKDILYQLQNPGQPWLTPAATCVLSSYLKPSDSGLEWGSGRSTVWFAQRVKRLTSVEHNRVWFSRVSQRLKHAALANVTYVYSPVGNGAPENPDSDYVNVAQRFPAASLDFVLVDGVQRSACACAVLGRIRPGGILVIDNANWFLPCRSHSPNSRTEEECPASDEWVLFAARMASWRCIWTSNGVTDTAIFIKPAR